MFSYIKRKLIMSLIWSCLVRHVLFFPQCSFQLNFHHWKCCKLFFCLKYQHKWNAWLLVFCFTGFFFSISVLFVYALLILYLTRKASWVLEACWFRLGLSYGCKSTNKKGWMCILWYEMWNKTTTIHPSWLNHALYLSYCTSVKDKPPHTKPKPYVEKEKPIAQLMF